MEEQKFDMKGPVIKYSIIIALVGILMTTIVYILDETLMIKWWFGLISLGVTLALLIYFGISVRNESGGFMTFKRAFTLIFLIVFFGTILSTVYTLLLHTVIDPELGSRLTEALIEQTASMLEGFGMPEDAIEESLNAVREQDNYSVRSLLKSMGIGSVVGGLIVGLIVGAIIKKKQPEADLM